MDMPLFRFDIENANPDRLAALVDDAQQEIERGNFHRACNLVLERLAIVGSPFLSEASLEAAARAMLATVRACLAFRTLDGSQAERAAATIGLVIPGSVGDWDGLLPHDLLMRHEALEQWRMSRGADGIRGIIIASLPRSGSAFVSNTIANCLNIPSLRCSFGHFPTMALVPQWTKRIVSGGAVTHDHFAATPFNQDILFAAGADHVVVQVRDPLDAFDSYFRILGSISRSSDKAGAPFDQAVVTGFLPTIEWLQSWRCVAQSGDGPKVTFVHFDDLTQKPEPEFRRILGPELWERFGAPIRSTLAAYAANKRTIPNHRSQQRSATEGALSAAQRKELTDLLPEGLESFLIGLRVADKAL